MPPRKRALKAVPPPANEPTAPPNLRVAVEASIARMTWLTPSDDALKALAIRQADEIEHAVARWVLLRELRAEAQAEGMGNAFHQRFRELEAWCDVARVVGTIGPQLQATLAALGGTPKSRTELAGRTAVGGRLAQLRKAAGVD